MKTRLMTVAACVALSGAAANYTLTFDAGEHGVLAGTSATSASVTVKDDAASALHWVEVTAAPGWCHVGWEPALPDKATVDQTFTAVYKPDVTTTVFYDSHATGNNDGSSWADAFTDLRAAVRACDATAKGLVKVRQGVHCAISKRNTDNNADDTQGYIELGNVAIVGGYTGDGDVRDQDPSKTILSGDRKNDDTWFTAENVDTGVKVVENGAFNPINPGNTSAVWRQPDSGATSNSDNDYSLFHTADTATHRDIRIEGMAVTGYGAYWSWQGGRVLSLGKHSRCLVTNCLFVANFPRSSGVLMAYGELDVRDCTFKGNSAASVWLRAVQSGPTTRRVYTDGKIASALCTIDGCRFERCFHNANPDNNSHEPYVSAVNAYGNTTLSRCVVTGCVTTNQSGYASYGVSTGVSRILDSVFSNNLEHVCGNKAAYMISAGVISNCTFVGNVVSRTEQTAGTSFLAESTVYDSVFESNSVMTASGASPAFMLTSYNPIWLYRTRFSHNVIEGAASSPCASLFSGACNLRDCSVAGNTVRGAVLGALVYDTWRGGWCVNSSFVDNTLAASDYTALWLLRTQWNATGNGDYHTFIGACSVARTPVDYAFHAAPGAAITKFDTIKVINSLLVGTPRVAVISTTAEPLVIRNSYCFGATGETAGVTVAENAFTETPELADRTAVSATGVGHRYPLLKAPKDYCRQSWQILETVDNPQQLFYQKTGGKPLLVTKDSQMSSTKVVIPDLVGAERPLGYVVLGAVQEVVKKGLTVLVR